MFVCTPWTVSSLASMLHYFVTIPQPRSIGSLRVQVVCILNPSKHACLHICFGMPTFIINCMPVYLLDCLDACRFCWFPNPSPMLRPQGFEPAAGAPLTPPAGSTLEQSLYQGHGGVLLEPTGSGVSLNGVKPLNGSASQDHSLSGSFVAGAGPAPPGSPCSSQGSFSDMSSEASNSMCIAPGRESPDIPRSVVYRTPAGQTVVIPPLNFRLLKKPK